MGKIYTHEWHAKKMKEVEKSVVDILTGEKPSVIYLLKGIDENDSIEKVSLAINYSIIHSTTAPRIIDIDNEMGYTIYTKIGEEKKLIISAGDYLRYFYDGDKIEFDNQFIWKGTVEEILEEFKNDGFTIKEELSREEVKRYANTYHEENLTH